MMYALRSFVAAGGMGEREKGERDRPYDFEERAHQFAKEVRAYCKRLGRT